MPYPNLPPPPSFWRCPSCGYELLFRVAGLAAVECGECDRRWTEKEVVEAHGRAHPAPVVSG